MASDTLRAGQLICDSTTPPPDRGFFKINDTTTGHVGKLVILDPVTEKQSQTVTAVTNGDGGIIVSDGSDKRGFMTAELVGGVPTGNFS